MKLYRAKLKSRKRIDAEIPREQQGWWADVCSGKTLMLRDATGADVARCSINKGQSRDPADYFCEAVERGSLVRRIAVETLVEIADRRAAPVAQLDADLPPLLTPEQIEILWARHADTAHPGSRRLAFARAVEQKISGQYVERIRHLERELAERARGLVGSIGDYTGFCSLLDGYGQALTECETAGYYQETIARKDAALAALIAYIDGRTAGTVPEKFGCHCDLEPGMEPDGCVIDANRHEDCIHACRDSTKEDCEYWQPIKFAAAPSTQEGAK